MDILSLNLEEIKAADAQQLKVAESEVRKKLATLRMDVYSASATNAGTVRKLRKTLARIKTFQTELSRTTKS